MPTPNYTSPSDYSAESQEIARRRKLAEALQAQGMQPMGNTEVIGGWAIPKSPFEGLGRAAQQISGAYQAKKATEQEKELNRRTQAEANQWVQDMPTADSERRNPINVASLSGGTLELPQDQLTPQELSKRRFEWALRGSQMANPLAQSLGASTIADEMKRQQMPELLKQFGYGAEQPAGGTQTASTQSAPMAQAQGAGIPRNIAMGLLLADPTGKLLATKIAEQHMETTKLINVPPGGTVYTPGAGAQFTAPNGANQITWQNGQPTMATMQGALPAMAAQTQTQAAATEAGKAPYQLETVNTQGAPSLMTREQAIGAATGQPMPQPAQMQPQAPMQGLPPQQEAQPAGIVQPPVPGGYAGLQATQPQRNAEASVIQSREQQPNGGGAVPTRAVIPQTPGLRLQDQGDAAQQRKFGEERGQLEAAAPQARASVADASTSLQRLENAANEIMNSPALTKITGLQSKIFNIPGSAASDIEARLGSLKSQVGFAVLQAMRDASKTGGALGAISDREDELLQRNLAALDQSQSTEGMKRSLQQLIDYAQGARERLQRGYADTYERVVGNQGMRPTQQGAEPLTRTQIIPPQGAAEQLSSNQPKSNIRVVNW